MWDFSSLTGDQTHTPGISRWNLNHWTTREAPSLSCKTHLLLASQGWEGRIGLLEYL